MTSVWNSEKVHCSYLNTIRIILNSSTKGKENVTISTNFNMKTAKILKDGNWWVNFVIKINYFELHNFTENKILNCIILLQYIVYSSELTNILFINSLLLSKYCKQYHRVPNTFWYICVKLWYYLFNSKK